MLSPIASRSAREAHGRRERGEPVKGTGRRLTTFAAPSLESRIAEAPSIEALALIRTLLGEMFRTGELTPSASTRRRWQDALWVRVFELMQAAQTPEEATFIVNVTFRWWKPPGLGEALEALMRERCAAMPAPATRWKIVGVNA